MPKVFLWQQYHTCSMCAPEAIPASASHTTARKILVYHLSVREMSGVLENVVCNLQANADIYDSIA